MGKVHLKRFAAPRTWAVARKKTKFITRPISGPHSMAESISLGVIIKEILGYVKTAKELKLILSNMEVLVDKVKRREYKLPVGFMDVLEFPKLNECYRVVYTNTGLLSLIKIDKAESNLKILKIIGKTTIKHGKTQINLSDGRNVLLNKDGYKVGDSLLFDLETKKIKEHFKLDKDVSLYLIGGKHIGSICKLKSIEDKKNLQKPKAVCVIEGNDVQTLKDYLYVVGKDKPAIRLK